MKVLKQLKIAAAVGVLACASCTDDSYARPATTAPLLPSPVVTAAADDRPGTDNLALIATPPTAEAANIAQRFGEVWFDTSGGAEGWLDRLRPLCEPGLMRALEAADPSSLTGRRIHGKPQITSGDDATWLYAAVPTDSGYLILTFAAIDGRWLVSDVDASRSLS
jgi:hypothetical protein